MEEGETLSSIAKKLHVSPVALREVNRLNDESALEQGTHLVVPLAPGKESSLARVREGGPRYAVRYRVRAGDTLEFIADRYDVTPYQIRRWNNLKTSKLTPGKPLRIYAAGGSRSGSSKPHSKRRKNSGQAAKGNGRTKATSGNGEAVTTPKANAKQPAEGR